MVFTRKDPMAGRIYRINLHSESVTGEVVGRAGEHIKIKVPDGGKTYKLNQTEWLEEVTALKALSLKRLVYKKIIGTRLVFETFSGLLLIA
jgi:hypothetical protein